MQSARKLLPMIAVCVLLAPFAACTAEKAKAAEAKPCFVRLGHYQCVCRQGNFEANLATV